MKLIKNNGFNLSFLHFAGRYVGVLFLMGFSMNGFSQLHVSGNTVFKVAENTTVYISAETSGQIPPNDTPPKKAKVKIAKQKNKTTKPEKPLVKKEVQTEPKQSVLVYTSKENAPVSLLFAGKLSNAALVYSSTPTVKTLSFKKIPKNSTQSISLNDNESQMKIVSNDFLSLQNFHSEEHITRPPPFSDLGALLI